MLNCLEPKCRQTVHHLSSPLLSLATLHSHILGWCTVCFGLLEMLMLAGFDYSDMHSEADTRYSDMNRCSSTDLDIGREYLAHLVADGMEIDNLDCRNHYMTFRALVAQSSLERIRGVQHGRRGYIYSWAHAM